MRAADLEPFDVRYTVSTEMTLLVEYEVTVEVVVPSSAEPAKVLVGWAMYEVTAGGVIVTTVV